MMSVGSSGMVRDTGPVADAQRRWTAVLFADVADSTAISEKIGLEATYGLMQELVGACWKVIEDHKGQTVEYAGDSILAVFGAPLAVENASLNACRAALGLQACLRDMREGFLARYGVAPELRIALAGGLVVVGNLGMDAKMQLNVLGGPVNLAARIEAIAAPGEILCSAAIFDQVEELVVAEHLGRKTLRGFAESQEIYRLRGLVEHLNIFEARLRRGAPDFFGRNTELKFLVDWHGGVADGPRTVDLVGPAGMGKSRLLHEFGRAVGSGVTILTGHCSQEEQSSSFAPVLEIVRRDIGWQRGDDRASVAVRLRARLSGDPRGLEFLTDLVGGFDIAAAASARDDAVNVRSILADLLRRLAGDPTKIVVFEDIHWIDPTSEELLRGLIAESDGRIQLVLSRRPGPVLSWMDAAPVARLALGRLERRHVARIIGAMLSAPEVPDALVDHIDRASEGLPLFAEEMVRFLRQTGQIVVDAEGIRFVLPEGTLGFSGNIQHLILSLFDRLDAATKACLEYAAAKGRRFSADFVAACLETLPAVQPCLEHAAAAQIVEPDTGAGPGSWRFAHALIGEAIYGSVIGEKRRRIHARIASVLETSASDHLADYVEELAYHHGAAEHPRETVFYLGKAAEKAFSIYAVDLVDSHLDRAFALIDGDPGVVEADAFSAMLLLWARALDILGDFRKLNAVLERHLPRLAQQGPSKALAVCLTLHALSRCHAAEFARSLDMIEHAAQVSAEIGDEASIAWTKVARMRIYVDSELEPHETVVRLYEEVRPIAERAGDSHLFQAALYTLQASYRATGALRKAEALADELERFGATRNDTRALAYGGWAKAILGFCRREQARVREAAKVSRQYSIPGTADWRVATVFDLCAGLLEPDTRLDPQALSEHIEWTRTRENWTLCFVATMGQVLACFKAGRLYEGWQRLQRARQQVQATGTAENRRTILLQQAEVFMAIAGVRRSGGPRPKLGVLDLVMLLVLRPTARRRAERLLREFLDRSPARDGFYVAYANFYLGLIEQSRGNHDAAASHLRLSHDLFTREGMDVRAAEVRASMTAETRASLSAA